MTAHRYKAELYLFADDPDFWVWQYLKDDGRWCFTTSPPAPRSEVKHRLVPRPWLDEPGKWDVECQRKRDMPTDYWHQSIDPEWHHVECIYRLRPHHKPLYQSRVEIPRPMTEEPEGGALCYYPDTQSTCVERFYWRGKDSQKEMLKAGFLYDHGEAAQARLDAMMKTEE